MSFDASAFTVDEPLGMDGTTSLSGACNLRPGFGYSRRITATLLAACHVHGESVAPDPTVGEGTGIPVPTSFLNDASTLKGGRCLERAPRYWREKALQFRTKAETTDLLLARQLKASVVACERAAAGLEEALAACGQQLPVPGRGKAAA